MGFPSLALSRSVVSFDYQSKFPRLVAFSLSPNFVGQSATSWGICRQLRQLFPHPPPLPGQKMGWREEMIATRPTSSYIFWKIEKKKKKKNQDKITFDLHIDLCMVKKCPKGIGDSWRSDGNIITSCTRNIRSVLLEAEKDFSVCWKQLKKKGEKTHTHTQCIELNEKKRRCWGWRRGPFQRVILTSPWQPFVFFPYTESV